MKRKSICLSLLLTLCIILSCIPVYAGNADFSDGGGNSQAALFQPEATDRLSH